MDNENPTSADSWLDKGAEFYATAAGLRTAIVGIGGAIGTIQPAVPAFIGAMDVVLTIKAQKVAERRLAVLCQSWEQELQGQDLSKVNRDYLQSEEFFDLLIKAWDATKRTRRDEKIALYAKVLKGALLSQKVSTSWEKADGHTAEDYLTLLSEMSYREFCVSSAIYGQQKEKQMPEEDNGKWLVRIGACTEVETTTPSYMNDGINIGPTTRKHMEWERPQGTWTDEDFDALALRLQGYGLVKSHQPPLAREYFSITTTLRSMMAFLEAD